jgi:hypothetical protein
MFLSAGGVLRVLEGGHSHRCSGVLLFSHNEKYLHFSDIDCEALLHKLISVSISLLWSDIFFGSSGWLTLLMLSSLYILDDSPLSDKSFATIFFSALVSLFFFFFWVAGGFELRT